MQPSQCVACSRGVRTAHAPLVQQHHMASHPQAATSFEYAAIIDAGTTGSRVHVFRYYLQPGSAYAVVELPDASHATAPGLGAYAFDPKTGANSLMPLLSFVKDKVCGT